MKRFVPFLLIMALSTIQFVGCNSDDKNTATISQTETTSVQTTDAPTTAAGSETVGSETNKAPNTGYAIITSIASSKPATAQGNGTISVNSTIGLVTVNPDGKLDSACIDEAQAQIPFDVKGQIPADFNLKVALPSKVEKKDAHGMKQASKISKEWYEQTAAYEKWVAGKTVAEVKGMAVKKVDDTHINVPDVAELASSVTVDVKGFQNVIEKASSNFVLGNPVATGDGHKSGIGVVSTLTKSKGASSEADGLAQVDSTIAFVTLDKDSKIANIKFDAAQTKVIFSADGTIKTNLSDIPKTKQELGSEYGMQSASSIKKEWNDQADAYAKWCVGKTIAEVKALKTKVVDENHTQVPDAPELTSSVTISVGEFVTALEKAVANAK